MQITSILSNIRSWLACGNRSKWLIFFLFASSLFVKTVLFHWTTQHSILLSSLWKAPAAFFAFWGGKLVPVLFLSAFVFIAKRQYWTIVINILLDIWCIANLFYFRANGFFLTFDMIFMADNMDGFWSSLHTYMGWEIVMFLFITGIYIAICCLTKIFSTTKRYTIITILMIIFAFLWASLTNFLYQKITYDKFGKPNKGQLVEQTLRVQYQYCFPFSNFYKDVIRAVWLEKGDWWVKGYINNNSIISYFPAMLLYQIHNMEKNNTIKISQEVEADIKNYIKSTNHDKTKQLEESNIIYILVESLESWALDLIENKMMMPKLHRLAQSNQVLYADKIVSQVRHGNSADGQMIGVTGLLPITSGATCKLYGKNVYPNFAHMYSNSAIINPSKGTWEQTTMTQSYEFHQLIEPEIGEAWQDMNVINNVLDYSFESDSSFCVLGITLTSHVPFMYGVEHTMHEFENMPQTMSAYLNCLHYTDSCIGVLLDSVLNSPLAENTTIVITGDHTIFRDEIGFSDMNKYAQDNSINFKAGHTFTPLIIYSPNIEGNIHISDTCYQMDIFPTILHLIGAEDYYWQGLGINLLDSVARKNRQITESEAYRLSDLIIRSDYFRNYCTISDSIVQSE